jgi:hypothetical protein
MSEKAFVEEKKNRALKEQINALWYDATQLYSTIQHLEQENISLVKKNVDIDWEMKYEPDSLEIQLPPLQNRCRPIKTKDQNTLQLTKQIVETEMQKRQRNVDTFGLIGQKMSLEPTTKMGPTRFYGTLVEFI